jgi:hypothetical protein
MDTVSRPLIAVLLGTVALFALWFVALKPGSSSNSNGKQSTSALQSDVAKAHQAVSQANSASVKHGGTIVSPQSSTTAASAASQPGQTSAAAKTSTTSSASGGNPAAANSTQPSAATQHRLDVVSRALEAKKVVALLFYNPAATDDRAVKRELAAVPVHRHLVVKLAVPLSEVARYHVVSTQVPVNLSPTLVLIDRQQHASTIVGFADRFEIAHRVADAAAS